MEERTLGQLICTVFVTTFYNSFSIVNSKSNVDLSCWPWKTGVGVGFPYKALHKLNKGQILLPCRMTVCQNQWQLLFLMPYTSTANVAILSQSCTGVTDTWVWHGLSNDNLVQSGKEKQESKQLHSGASLPLTFPSSVEIQTPSTHHEVSAQRGQSNMQRTTLPNLPNTNSQRSTTRMSQIGSGHHWDNTLQKVRGKSST